MQTKKKDGRCLNCIISRDVFEQLETYCNEVGQTKTLAVERILKKFFTDYYKASDLNGESK